MQIDGLTTVHEDYNTNRFTGEHDVYREHTVLKVEKKWLATKQF